VRWPDGSAVPEFEATASTKYRSRMSTVRNAEFELCGLDLDLDWTIEVEAQEGERVGTAKVTEVRPGGPELVLVLETATSFRLEIEVRDAAGEPVPHFTAYASTPGRSINVRGEGTAVLEGLTVGEWRIHVFAPGFESQTSTVSLAPGSGPLVFELSSQARLHGRVIDTAGNAVAGADAFVETRWDGEQQDTDEAGNFDIQVASGELRVRARHIDFGISDALEFEVKAGARLEGRVLDAAGQPAPGVHVMVSGSWSNAETASDGSFVLECLAPGTARVFASDIGGRGQVEGIVELLRGQTSMIELRFLARDPVRVHGRATLAGQPFVGPLNYQGEGAWAQGL
jgi:flagellar biosynthesis/type III secretory pathway ATPase